MRPSPRASQHQSHVIWLFEIPLAYWLAIPLKMRSNGAFFAIAIAEGTMAAVSAILFRQGRWKKQKI